MCSDSTYLHIVDQTKYLGLWLHSELTFKPHIDYILCTINFETSVLFQSKNCFTLSVQKKLASQLILPFFDDDDVYQNALKTNLLPLNTAYRFALSVPLVVITV